MAEGLERRAAPQDNLRGSEAVDPVTRAVPGLGTPSLPSVPDNSFSDRIVQQVGRFAQGRLAEIQQKRQERSMLDGQLAALQGRTFDEVEMAGDKWALEGYRVVTAQTMGASLLRAQEKEINSGAYEKDPEVYRKTLGDRITALTADIPDERTRMLARDSLMKQMPGLIDLHMRMNLGFKEQQNFDALAASVDVLSRDNSNTGALIAFATGESEATKGLSIERRRKAVVQGVVNAFENNNPAAYAHLEAAGFFTTDNLTASQLQMVRKAQNAYEARLRQQWNGELATEMTALEDRVKAGDVDPLVAAEEQAKILAKHGLRMRASEGQGIYDRARAGVEYAEGTRGMNIAAAGAAGDYDMQARLMQAAVIHQESRGRADAVSPAGAVGIMQLMPGTMVKPGFGLKNIFMYADEMGIEYDRTIANASETAKKLAKIPELNKAMGTDYLAAMLKRYGGNVEKALVAYNWGAGNADKWDGDHAKLPAETRTYVKNITKAFMDDRPDPAALRAEAERNYELARKRAGLQVLERVAPIMAENDELFMRRERSLEDWRKVREATYAEWGLELDAQRLNEERSMMRSVIGNRIEELQKQADSAEATATAVKLETSIATADEVLRERRAAFEAGTGTMTLDQINEEYMGSVLQAYRDSGADLDPRRISTAAAGLVRDNAEMVRKALAANEERAIISNAEAGNTVGTLPPEMMDKAVAKFREDLGRRVKEYEAEHPDAKPAEVAAVARTAEIDYLARNGIVDETLKQQINLAAGGNWTDAKGEPRPSVAVGLHSFMSLLAKNSELAYQYVPDPKVRGRMLAAAHAVMAKFPDRDTFATVDLTNRNDPVTNEIYDAVQQVGLHVASPPSAEVTATRVDEALSLVSDGNLNNSFIDGIMKSPLMTFGSPVGLTQEMLVGTRDTLTEMLIPNNETFALTTSEFDVADVRARTHIDPEAIEGQFGTHVRRFIEEVVPHMPNTSSDGAITMAMKYVRDRGAIMGNTYIMPKPGEPSIRAQMFPGQTGISTAATNTAIVQWMQSPDTIEKNAVLKAWDDDRGFFGSDVPEFTVSRLDGKYVAHIVGFGSLVLPMREIGDLYVSTR